MLSIAVEAEGSETRITLRGELSLSCYDELERALELAEDGDAARLLIDLGDLVAIDSAGIGCLVHAVERARDTRTEVSMIRGPRAVMRVFEMVGLADVLPFRSSPNPSRTGR